MVVILLKKLIKGNEAARRIFGKKEIEIIIKQLDGLKLTQSEMNRLSRDIKPKLNFIKEISKYDNEFALKKNQNNKNIIEKVVEVVLNDELNENIRAILLFGSFADRTNIPKSDIDICVVFRKSISLKEATKFRIRNLGKLPKKVDLHVFNVLPMKLKRDIARNHKVLYKNKDYDNINFSIKYLKDNDYFIRMNRIFKGVEA